MEASFSHTNLDDSRSKAILIVTCVFLAISLVSVILRCFVRSRIVRAFGWDDSVMVLAMVSRPSPSELLRRRSAKGYAGPEFGFCNLRNHRM